MQDTSKAYNVISFSILTWYLSVHWWNKLLLTFLEECSLEKYSMVNYGYNWNSFLDIIISSCDLVLSQFKLACKEKGKIFFQWYIISTFSTKQLLKLCICCSLMQHLLMNKEVNILLILPYQIPLNVFTMLLVLDKEYIISKYWISIPTYCSHWNTHKMITKEK